ncbi:WD repeat domain phosphoinositide-interacting protein 2 isoform X2 [Ixodes scapularis]|uniref:WD repeat domain phosphoinositide-interacting protein 2 isoform X2 n=1 Tax=Ixodes scapularis TaxID=6945 RepID=UPI001AD749E0|nr:WD repeat domain phosphoinositide-interacting protein 2 isoform X2 [Ixodes scapularis]
MQNLAANLNHLSKGVKHGVGGLMNLASEGGDPPNAVFVNFNQDCTSLAVGTATGYKLFSLSNIDRLEQIYENETEGTCLVERLFSSSLVALVGASSARKLKVCHFKKGSEICNYSYSNSILAVRLNRVRLVVCLEESLYIHNIRDMKVMHTIRETPPNPRGLCALSISNENCYLAYPGSDKIGEVQIFDASNLQAKVMIPAHDSPLAALAFNTAGTLIATASEKGTVIRVFNVSDGLKLYEFRRGMKRCVSICSLSFSADSQFLCASSNTETVHIFKLEDPKEVKVSDEPATWMGYFGKALMQSASYLPSQVTEVFNQGRAFASVHLPFCGVRTVCALITVQKIPRVLVATTDGFLYVYNLDPAEGGDCTLARQHRLDGREAATTTATAAATAAIPPVADGGPDKAASPATTQQTAAARKPDPQGKEGIPCCFASACSSAGRKRKHNGVERLVRLRSFCGAVAFFVFVLLMAAHPVG